MLLSRSRIALAHLPTLRTAASAAAGAAAISAAPAAVAAARAVPLLARRAYHERVIDHYENPRNVGSLPKSSPSVGTGLVGAPACGDVMKLQMEVGDDGVVQRAVFKTFGCGSAIASSSLATSWAEGRHIDDVLRIKNTDIAKHLALPPVKLHCSMLAEDAIKAAVADYKAKQAKLKGGAAAAAPAAGASAATATATPAAQEMPKQMHA